MSSLYYHHIASLCDDTAEKAEHISKGSVLALLWWLVAQTAVSGSATLVPFLLDLLANALYNHLHHQVKGERHYKVYTRTSVYSRVSPRTIVCYVTRGLCLYTSTLYLYCNSVHTPKQCPFICICTMLD